MFAANEEARQFVSDSVYQAEQRVVSVDNSYIANKNLDLYSPKVSINSVTEDEDSYYISYTFTTIALDNYVWQDVAQQRTMQVAKTALGDYTDLGVYVTEQLKQVVARELQHLHEVQAIERKQVTSKVVATAYSGLVGQFIDDSTEQLPGYVPQVYAPQTEEVDPVAVARAKKDDAVPFDFEAAQQQGLQNSNVNTPSGSSGNNGGPVISILGANPARIPIGSKYSDLGIFTTTPEGVTLDLSVNLWLNGKEVKQIDIDTSTVADWSVGYSVTYNEKTTNAERVVIVYDPNAPVEEETATTTATTTEESSTEQNTMPESTIQTGTQEIATTTEEVTEEVSTSTPQESLTQEVVEDTSTSTDPAPETTESTPAATTTEETTTTEQ